METQRCEGGLGVRSYKHGAPMELENGLGEVGVEKKRGPVSGDRAKQKAELNCDNNIGASRVSAIGEKFGIQPRGFTGGLNCELQGPEWLRSCPSQFLVARIDWT